MRSAAAAIVLAGGSGARVGAGHNKVYLPLGGRTVLGWSLRAFATHPEIGTVVLVTRPEDAERAGQEVADLALPVEIVTGGATRQDSEWCGLHRLAERITTGAIDTVLIHDGARPLVSAAVISAVLTTARAHGGAVPGLLRDDLAAVVLDGSCAPDTGTPSGADGAAAPGGVGGGAAPGGVGGAVAPGGVGGAVAPGGVGGAVAPGGVGGAVAPGGVGGGAAPGGVGGGAAPGGVGGGAAPGGAGGAAAPSGSRPAAGDGAVVRWPPDAEGLVAVQTPQGFRAGPLLAAYDQARADGFVGTDTASCVQRYTDLPVRWVPGDERNLKITYPHDLARAARLVSSVTR